MKRTVLLILLLAPIALAGCQTVKKLNPFRDKEPAYKSAQQAPPLQVPPGMEQPPTTEALTIPDVNASAASTPTGVPAMQPESGATAAEGTAVDVTDNSMNLADTPANAYRRVGLALQRGGVGEVASHDDNALIYQVAVDTVVKSKKEGGFFHRLFHRSKDETVKGTVTVSVTPKGGGSMVQASGNADAVARVMGVLRQRLR